MTGAPRVLSFGRCGSDLPRSIPHGHAVRRAASPDRSLPHGALRGECSECGFLTGCRRLCASRAPATPRPVLYAAHTLAPARTLVVRTPVVRTPAVRTPSRRAPSRRGSPVAPYVDHPP
jgi:hypothetical protein